MIGERLKVIRKGKFTQAELAEKIGVHEITIRRWESGHRSPSSADLIRSLFDFTGSDRFLFPSAKLGNRPIGESSIYTALQGISNYKITPHGFRSMASTLLNEKGFPPDVIERQLAHAERNAIRAAYNHAEYLPERRKMMQFWADYLYELRGA